MKIPQNLKNAAITVNERQNLEHSVFRIAHPCVTISVWSKLFALRRIRSLFSQKLQLQCAKIRLSVAFPIRFKMSLSP
jgi:hypothetical protein